MSFETHKYNRKPFSVDAVQVTADNIHEVAKWCMGKVETENDGRLYIKVKVRRPLTDRQTKAYIGDWVLYAGTGFKVYTDRAFTGSFENPVLSTTVFTPAERASETAFAHATDDGKLTITQVPVKA